jgi:hypothetical protein
LLVDLDIPGHLHSAQLVTEWLGRSKMLPLDIKLNDELELEDYENGRSGPGGTPPPSGSPFNSAVAVVGSINRVSTRWRRLDFMGVALHITMYLDDYALDPDTDLSQPARLQHFSASRYDADFENATSFLYNANQNYSPTHLATDGFVLIVPWISISRTSPTCT